MNLQFFGITNPKLSFDVCLTIFSFIPDDLSLVSTRWAAFYKDKKRPLPVLPTLYRIPRFAVPPEELEVSQLSGGMTNGTFKLDIKNDEKESWVLRIVGKGTSTFIDRNHEKMNAEMAARLGLNVTVEWFDHEGNQLTPFLRDSLPLSSPFLEKTNYLEQVAHLFRMLHRHYDAYENAYTITHRISKLLSIIQTKNPALLPRESIEIERYVDELTNVLNHFMIRSTFCHNDPTASNFLVVDTKDMSPKLYLIDWEYASKGDLIWDLVYFCLLSELDDTAIDKFLALYFGTVTETMSAWFVVYKPLVTWWVTLWSYAQIANESISCNADSYISLAETNLSLTLEFFKSSTYQQALLIMMTDKENNLNQIMPRSF